MYWCATPVHFSCDLWPFKNGEPLFQEETSSPFSSSHSSIWQQGAWALHSDGEPRLKASRSLALACHEEKGRGGVGGEGCLSPGDTWMLQFLIEGTAVIVWELSVSSLAVSD